MKNIAIVLAAILVLLTTTSWNIWSWATGSDNIEAPSATITKKTIKLKSFEELTVSRGLKVHYTPGKGEPVIMITAPQNYHQYLSLKNSDNDLEISLTPKNVHNEFADKFTIVLTGGNPKGLEANSAGSILVESDITSNSDLDISASSAGSVFCNGVSVRELECSSSSAAKISIDTAKATEIEAVATSAASISISGINATKVSGDANSAASLSLSGTCSTLTLESSSGASIHASDLKANEGSAGASSGSSIKCRIKNPSKINSNSGGSVSNR